MRYDARRFVMSEVCKMFGHKMRHSKTLDADVCDRCDSIFNAKVPDWARPVLNEMVRLQMEAENKGQPR